MTVAPLGIEGVSVNSAVDRVRFTLAIFPATGNGLGDAVTGALTGELPTAFAEMAVTE